MTFTEISTEITEDLNLSSSTAVARVGREINIRYRGIVSSIGLKTSKPGTNTQASVGGTNEITFTGLNMVTRVEDFTGGVVRELKEVTWDEIRELTLPSSNTPIRWALKTVGSITVVVAFDVAFTSAAVSLRADGFTPMTTLSGSTEPIFPQDFHDILVWGVKADEYMKMEKPAMAKYCEAKAASRLSELRLYLATNLYTDKRQSGNINLGTT
jgi:hypothetical protein